MRNMKVKLSVKEEPKPDYPHVAASALPTEEENVPECSCKESIESIYGKFHEIYVQLKDDLLKNHLLMSCLLRMLESQFTWVITQNVLPKSGESLNLPLCKRLNLGC